MKIGRELFSAGIAVCVMGALLLVLKGSPSATAESGSPVESDWQAVTLAGEAAPVCDDQEVTETVQDIFDTHQACETMTNLELIAVSDMVETGNVTNSSGEWRAVRTCGASGSLSNAESIELWYQIRMPRVDDAIGYRVTPCFLHQRTDRQSQLAI